MTIAAARTLSNGVSMPSMAFGSGTSLYAQDVERLCVSAVEAGFRHLDTAQMYLNEESVGRAIAHFPRESLFVTTKLASLRHGETVRDSIMVSLQRLGIDYVDLWLIHTSSQHLGRLKEVWKGCEEVYNEGLARSIGVSNFTLQQLQEILEVATVVPHVHQLELHPYVYQASKPLLDLNRQYRIVTASYSVLSPIARGPNALDAVLTRVRSTVEERLGGRSVSDSQILMKWAEAKGAIVITTTSRESRMREYLLTADVPSLTSDEVGAIDEEASNTHYRRWWSYMDH